MKQQDFLLFDIAVAIKEPCRVVCGNNNYVIKDMYVSSQNILSKDIPCILCLIDDRWYSFYSNGKRNKDDGFDFMDLRLIPPTIPFREEFLNKYQIKYKDKQKSSLNVEYMYKSKHITGHHIFEIYDNTRAYVRVLTISDCVEEFVMITGESI